MAARHRTRVSPPARETFYLFACALVGILATFAVLFGDALVLRIASGDWVGDIPGWRDYRRATWTTLGEAHWQRWLALLAAQGAAWAILAPLLVREYRTLPGRVEWPDLAATVAPVVAIFVVVDLLRFSDPLRSPLPGHFGKLTVLTWLGLAVALIAVAGLVRVGRVASTLDGDAAEEHARLQRQMRFFLAGAGIVIGAAVLAGGALSIAAEAEYTEEEPAPVLAYGLLLSALLAAIYAPVFAAVKAAGERVAEAVAPVPSPKAPGWSAAYARRREVAGALGLETSLADSLRGGIGVLAPLISAALSLLLPEG